MLLVKLIETTMARHSKIQVKVPVDLPNALITAPSSADYAALRIPISKRQQ